MDSEFARVRALAFEPYTLFRVRPMSGRHVNVSEHGFRRGSAADVWPPDPSAANIFVFGGSTAFGYGVDDAQTIPSQLGNELSRLAAGQRVAVYNFATPNYDSVQERICLEQLLLNGHVPRVAVFIDGFDEFIAPYYAPLMMKPFVDATAPAPRGRLSRIVRQFMSELRRGRSNGSSGTLPDPVRVLDRYLSNVRLVQAVCAEFDVHSLFVWQPVPCYHYDGEGRWGGSHGSSAPLIEIVRAGYDLMNSRRGNDFTGPQFLWLGDMQKGRTDNLYLDPDHYTAGFSREIAARIASHVSDHLLPG